MKYGRTSMVNFLSQLVMSLSGFVATIVLTRTLGQSQYGTYVVVLSVLAWVAIAGNLGISPAIKKRVSEASSGNYVVSGVIVQFALYVPVAIGLWLARPYLNEFMSIEATWVLILMLAVKLGSDLIQVILDAQHLVHISSLLSPVEWTSRSIIQVLLVLSGFGIAGAFAGYIVGAIVAIIVGAYFVTVPKSLPSRTEFYQLKEYAQFSWLGSIRGRTFLSMDTIILAIFVSNSLIAVYEVAWNLASLFAIFGTSISRTLFPEMSEMASKSESSEEIPDLLRVSLTYAGLFIVPGLVGAALVGDVVLTIYGSGFSAGYYILLVLTFARLVYGYRGQFMNTINALDRPDLTFRIDAIFVGSNLVLNVVLTWQYGWYGAAAATTASAFVGLVLGYYYANQLIPTTIPYREIGKQWFASGIMAGIVILGRLLAGDSLPVVVGLVAIGAVSYFVVLFLISQEFRITVRDNLPFQLPGFVPQGRD